VGGREVREGTGGVRAAANGDGEMRRTPNFLFFLFLFSLFPCPKDFAPEGEGPKEGSSSAWLLDVDHTMSKLPPVCVVRWPTQSFSCQDLAPATSEEAWETILSGFRFPISSSFL